MFKLKSSKCLTYLVTLASILTFPNVAQAAIDFNTWSSSGDVTNTTDGASLSTNSLSNDDSPDADTDYNFSNSAAISSSDLETNLGLTAESLDPDPGNFIQATEGSGLNNQLTFAETTLLSFDWTFLTNDSTFVDGSGFRFADYAFVSIDNSIQTIASTDSILNPSATNYINEATGIYTNVFSPGTYDVAIGVVDVDNTDLSSALILSDASTTAVPFEFTPGFGLISAISFWGVLSYRKRLKHKIDN